MNASLSLILSGYFFPDTYSPNTVKKKIQYQKIIIDHQFHTPAPYTHTALSAPSLRTLGKLPLNYTKSAVFLKNDSWEHSSQIKFLECCPSQGASRFTEHVQRPTINTRFSQLCGFMGLFLQECRPMF